MILFSNNSFLQHTNCFHDSNAMMTIGKKMKSGEVFYKDFYEHKGPYFCFFCEASCLISDINWNGMFLFEVVLFSIFLFGSYKSMELIDDKKSLFLIPVVATICIANRTFVNDVTAEQMAIPMLELSLYLFIKAYGDYSKKEISINEWEWLLHGIFIGIIFWIKYTLLICYVVWYMFFLFYYLKNMKELIKVVIFTAVGIFLATIPLLIYCLYNNCLYEVFDVYIYKTIFVYNANATGGNIFYRILQVLVVLLMRFFETCVIVGGTYLIIREKNKIFIYFSVIPMITFMLFNTYIKKSYDYTWAIMDVFVAVALIYIVRGKNVREYKKKSKIFAFTTILMCGLIITAIMNPNIKYKFLDKKKYVSYAFKEEIVKVDNPRIGFYKSGDPGICMELDYICDLKYFNYYNVWTAEMKNEIYNCMRNKELDFVISNNVYIDDEGIKELKKNYYPVINSYGLQGMLGYKYTLWKLK